MSARPYRQRRWEKPSTRPAVRAMSSASRRARYTVDEVDQACRTAMDAGAIMGRRQGARDTYEFLAELLDDPTELTYQIGRYVLHGEIQEYLDTDLLRRARDANPEKFSRMADLCRAHDNGDVPDREFLDDLEALAREVGVFPPAEPADVPLPVTGVDELLDQAEHALTCPPWCVRDHSSEETEVAGITLTTLHENTPTEVVGEDPAYVDTPTTIAAWVERSDEAGKVVTPTRVVLAVTDGTKGHYPGGEGVQGWSGTVEQVEQLGRALLGLAATVRAEQGPGPRTDG